VDNVFWTAQTDTNREDTYYTFRTLDGVSLDNPAAQIAIDGNVWRIFSPDVANNSPDITGIRVSTIDNTPTIRVSLIVGHLVGTRNVEITLLDSNNALQGTTFLYYTVDNTSADLDANWNVTAPAGAVTTYTLRVRDVTDPNNIRTDSFPINFYAGAVLRHGALLWRRHAEHGHLDPDPSLQRCSARRGGRCLDHSSPGCPD
jgi:hypothetical protein